MKQCSLVFDPIADVCKVEQFGFIDLARANAMSSIPSSLSAEDLQFNGIDDPRSIAGRPSDEFEAMQAAKVIAGYKVPSKSGEGSEGSEVVSE